MELQQTTTDARLKELVLHVASMESCDEQRLSGILFRIDFWSYLDRGRSVTGEVYIQRGDTAAPRRLQEVLRDLRLERAMKFDRFGHIVPRREANLELFTDGELSFVEGLYSAESS